MGIYRLCFKTNQALDQTFDDYQLHGSNNLLKSCQSIGQPFGLLDVTVNILHLFYLTCYLSPIFSTPIRHMWLSYKG